MAETTRRGAVPAAAAPRLASRPHAGAERLARADKHTGAIVPRVAAALMLALALLAGESGAAPPVPPAAAFLDAWCLDCHEGTRPKGGLDLAALLDAAAPAPEARAAWRRAAQRVRAREMPPLGRDAPSDDSADAFTAAVAAWLAETAPAEPMVHGPALRRVNRREYANAVRDLLGVDFDAARFLPDDDVGEGFDTTGDVLGLSPLLLERLVDAAERIAITALPDRAPPVPPVVLVPGPRLDGDRASLREGAAWLASAGAVGTPFVAPIAGSYRIRVRASGMQAGPEPVKLSLRANGRTLATVEVPERFPESGVREAVGVLAAGPQRIEAAFINDYYRPDAPDPRDRDRNAAILALEIEGPLETAPPGPFAAGIHARLERDGEAAWARILAELAPRAWRGAVPAGEGADLVAAATQAAGDGASAEAKLRAGLVAILVHPRFLLLPGVDDQALRQGRAAADAALAARLAALLWASVPDAALLDAAAAGALRTSEGLEREVRRLLDDPRAVALAEGFAVQWLQIGRLSTRAFDPDRFEGVDAALLAWMQAETVLLFDELRRRGAPVRALLETEHTWLNERLAAHYGVPGVRGAWMRPVALAGAREGGILAHGSVLAATSNPTRTSPVKRGKWVLEVLFDEPPPAPPPDVPPLPETSPDAVEATLRARLERHRADPACATCHRRMDALGLALEGYDAVGRRRLRDDGARIDDRVSMPGVGSFSGLPGLRDVVLRDRVLERSLVRHLLVHALGRGLAPDEWDLVEAMAAPARGEATIDGLVVEVARVLERAMRPGE